MNACFASRRGTRSCGRRGPASDGSTVERSSSTICEYVGGSCGIVPEQVLLAVGLDERDALRWAACQPQIAQRLGVDREEPARRPVFRRHVPDGRAVRERERLEPVSEVLDELPDDARLAQDLRHRQHEVGRGRALWESAGQPEPDHLRDEHRDRLAEHRGLRLDPADAPAEHAEAVDHRRMRVGPDEGVRKRDAVPVIHYAVRETRG